MTRSPSTATPTTGETNSAPSAALHTPEHALLAALVHHPHSSSAELAELAGVGGSTARRVLATAQQKGMVDRLPGDRSTGRRSPDRWSLVTSSDASAPEHDESPTEARVDDEAETDTAPPGTAATSEPAAKRERLGKGALRGLVEDFLREHPEQEFGPTAIGKALQRSAGAVNNACEKLVADGYARQARQAPKRFTLAPDEPAA